MDLKIINKNPITKMSPTITEYRCKLINKILFARSEDEVRRFIAAAMRGLKEHKVNGHLITRFVEKASQDLNGFSPMNQDVQQWANIKTARMQFNQLKTAIRENEKGS